jgi:hypothetical protein
MTAKRIPIPPSVGGGDVVMRKLSVGEYEDIVKAFANASGVDTHSALVQASIVELRGRPVPVGIVEREPWWRSQDLDLRSTLSAYYLRLNSADSKEISDFFASAKPEMGPGTPRSI